jgi:hypothetical protein
MYIVLIACRLDRLSGTDPEEIFLPPSRDFVKICNYVLGIISGHY